MKPYAKKPFGSTKGVAGCRKSKASAHRARSLRRDKKSARQAARDDDSSALSIFYRNKT